ncbi:tetratricopeptide repeat-containing sensor histidine kinase [Aquimarina litoralis]|uniref:tetratricopeptide repeat-containing sensor histidine kinase n=1 Tax=Aquimarina litoralis TaxID=584605 RepID=UPI001C5663AE|nr:tetratricopeptide repeat-containing sensor histidine kinase [Aquimarina litoralis]MBW1298477.1 tetratricopeptide repeat protein [Aquimarina litoralis]
MDALYKSIYQTNSDSISDALHRIIKKNKGINITTKAYGLLSHHYDNKGIFDSASFYCRKVIQELKDSKDSLYLSRISSAYRVLGSINEDLGTRTDALHYYLAGLKIAEDIKDAEAVITHKNGIANIYLENEEYNKAQKIYEENLANYKGDNIGVTYNTYINLGIIAYEKKKTEESISYYKKALKICEDIENYRCISKLYLNIGAAYDVDKNFDKKITNFKKSIQIAEENSIQDLALLVTYNLGVNYSNKAQYELALNYFHKALKKANQQSNYHVEQYIYEELDKIFVAKDNYKKAYEYQEKTQEVIRIVDSIQSNVEIEELQLKYETSEKEKEILTLREEQLIKDNHIARQNTVKWAILIGFGILLIPIGFLMNTYYQRMKMQRKLNNKLIEVNQQKIVGLIKDQELKLVRASIEGQDRERKRIAQQLHDSVGGNLSSIKLQLDNMQQGKTSHNKVVHQIDDTYDLIREISHNLIPKKFSQNPFTSLITEYLNNVQSSSDLTIIFNPYPEDKLNQIQQEIQVELFNIIQELLTNALKHAKASSIAIQLDHLNNEIKLIFEDNGIGFNVDKNSNGIGLSNIKNRLLKFEGKLFIDSKPNHGTVINIDIPIIK